MRKSKFSESQIVGILKDAESGMPVGVAAHVKPRKSGPRRGGRRGDYRLGFCSCFRFCACSASRLR
jgi:hypothetical protein